VPSFFRRDVSRRDDVDRIPAFGEDDNEQAALRRCPHRGEAGFVKRVENIGRNVRQRIVKDRQLPRMKRRDLSNCSQPSSDASRISLRPRPFLRIRRRVYRSSLKPLVRILSAFSSVVSLADDSQTVAGVPGFSKK
jgi:hypothetical protein